MVKIRKYANIVERMLRGEKGQRFFNFAYSIGAAIVIWGALFKILHLPGGNTLLCIGMGTEVMMFILTAFDRPPKEYAWEEVFPELEGGESRSHRDHSEHLDHSASASEQGPSVQIVGGPASAVGAPSVAGAAYAPAAAVVSEIPAGSQPAGGSTVIVAGGGGSFGGGNVSLPDIEAPVEGFREMVEAHCADYDKSMAALNRNIVALNQLYELQLKTMAAQLEVAERAGCGMKDIRDMYEKSASQSARFCEETEKMARNMRRLNNVYERMLTAMTVNMGLAQAPVEMPQNPFDTAEAARND